MFSVASATIPAAVAAPASPGVSNAATAVSELERGGSNTFGLWLTEKELCVKDDESAQDAAGGELNVAVGVCGHAFVTEYSHVVALRFGRTGASGSCVNADQMEASEVPPCFRYARLSGSAMKAPCRLGQRPPCLSGMASQLLSRVRSIEPYAAFKHAALSLREGTAERDLTERRPRRRGICANKACDR